LKTIFQLGLLITLMMLVKYGCNFYTLYARHLMAVKMDKDMRRDLFCHLQTLSFRFFDNRQTGELMSRMINDIGRVTDAVNHAPEDIFLPRVHAPRFLRRALYNELEVGPDLPDSHPDHGGLFGFAGRSDSPGFRGNQRRHCRYQR
jgi:ABC-type multidrug transport system fused ATPase/permease subunit